METTTNRKCLKFVYTSELYHHGIMGMSWGERNGPPYPLGGIDKKISRIEAKRKIAREKALEKARKAAKAKRKAEAKDRKREERAAAQAEKDQLRKAKLLARGDLKDIYRNRELFTTQELNDAVNRSRILDQAKKDKRNKTLERRQQKLEDEAYRRARKEQKEAEKNKSKKTMSPEEIEKTWEDRLKKVANMATSVGTIANSATSVVKLIEEIAAGARRSDIHVKDLELKDLEISKRKKDSISIPDIGNVKETKKDTSSKQPSNSDKPKGLKLLDIASKTKENPKKEETPKQKESSSYSFDASDFITSFTDYSFTTPASKVSGYSPAKAVVDAVDKHRNTPLSAAVSSFARSPFSSRSDSGSGVDRWLRSVSLGSDISSKAPNPSRNPAISSNPKKKKKR